MSLLVAIDGSEASWVALHLAARNLTSGNTLKMLHITPLGEPTFGVSELFARAEAILAATPGLSSYSWELVHAELGTPRRVRAHAHTRKLAFV